MPTYEYECENCHHHFEELQTFNEDPIEKCPECGGKAKRLISHGAGLIFRGSGFYITDYVRKKNGKSSEKERESTAEKEKPSSEKKEAKTETSSSKEEK